MYIAKKMWQMSMEKSYETKASEWKKGTGPAKIDFSDEGTKVIINEGVNLYYYQKPVNVRDFTVKVKFNTPVKEGGYFAMTIGGNGKYTGAGGAQNFIVMWVRGDHLCIDPQVLHNGKADVKPASRNLYVDFAEKDVLFHFKKINDLTYSIEVEEQGFYYEYCIPENFNWVEDVNGEGCLGFGGSIGASVMEEHGEGSVNILIKEINGVKMNGQPVVEDTSSSDKGTTGGTDSDVDPDTGINTGVIGGGDVTADTNNATDATTEEGNNTLLIIIIILGGLLLITIVASVLTIIILLKKKAAEAPVEEVVEETEE